MSLVLVFPPLADPTQPYSSLPTLTAFFRSQSNDEIVPLDANVRFVRQLLSVDDARMTAAQSAEKRAKTLCQESPPRGFRTALESAGERTAERLRSLEAQPILDASQLAEYRLLAIASLKLPSVMEAVDGAVRDLQNPDVFNDLPRLDRSKRVLRDAISIVSASCYPLTLSFSESGGLQSSSPQDIGYWAQDSRSNPFRDFLEKDTLPRIAAASPALVGISVTYSSQVLAAATLSVLIHERLPGVPIVYGGSMPTRWYNDLESLPQVFDWCDYLVAFEGEMALSALWSVLKGKGKLEHVPNLAYRERGRILKTALSFQDLNALPTPDYRGLPLDLYLSPEPVLLLSTSRGCYWSRCRFCSVSPSMRLRYRVRDPDLVHRDILTLYSTYGARCISFADDCVAPSTLGRIADKLRRRGPRISWQCEVRFEPALDRKLLRSMRRAGCVNLIFGLESYCGRVLSLMDKGTRTEEIKRIVTDCRKVGIAFNLQLFFGFPGETLAEAETTLEFVQQQLHGAATIGGGVFELQKGSRLAEEPSAFGLEMTEARDSLKVSCDYTPRSEYAEEMRDRLRLVLKAHTPYPHLAFGIDAHTLVLLHRCGRSGLARIYRSAAPPPEHRPAIEDLLSLPLARAAELAVGEFAHSPLAAASDFPSSELTDNIIIIYNSNTDKAIAVSRLAAWLLEKLDGAQTPFTLVGNLLTTEEPTTRDGIVSEIGKVVKELYERGFLLVPRQPQSVISPIEVAPL
jgi:hypothetical protein